jgi:2,3-bisphosphoglycerate-dependent phosphoglycerate mutase
MKLILLRHEERGFDVGFYSDLTDNGIINSLLLPNKLKKLKIDTIFSSPFIRTLQTIYPYANKYNKKVNIEYGLYEYIHNPYFLLIPWYQTINDIKDNDLKNIINKKYNSIVNKDDFIILENEINLENRIIKFFNYLLKNYKNNTVLLVTHKGVINKIIDLYVKPNSLENNFEMGHYEIYKI